MRERVCVCVCATYIGEMKASRRWGDGIPRYSMQSTVLLIYHQAVPVPSPSQVLLYSLFLYSFPKKKTKMKKKRHRVFPFINSHSNIYLITSHTDNSFLSHGPQRGRVKVPIPYAWYW